MLVKYEGYNLVVYPEIEFIMLRKCYENGCNCSNCIERFTDGCIIDDISMDDLTLGKN